LITYFLGLTCNLKKRGDEGMLKVEDLHHVSIPVVDAEGSREFYKSILALDEIERPDFDFLGVWFRLGSRQAHLVQHLEAKTLRGIYEIDSRDGHLALRVNSYRETREHLIRLVVPFLDRPVNPTPWPQIYITDPDGNVIELNAVELD
jgi:catechol 2,3-dioxygenase-like lactoylglutathione lyase family enzyme